MTTATPVSLPLHPERSHEILARSSCECSAELREETTQKDYRHEIEFNVTAINQESKRVVKLLLSLFVSCEEKWKIAQSLNTLPLKGNEEWRTMNANEWWLQHSLLNVYWLAFLKVHLQSYIPFMRASDDFIASSIIIIISFVWYDSQQVLRCSMMLAMIK